MGEGRVLKQSHRQSQHNDCKKTQAWVTLTSICIALLDYVPRPIAECAAGYGHGMPVIVAEPNAGAIRARDAGAVPGPRAVGAVALDLVEVSDALADVEDGREWRVPRDVTQDVARIPRPRLDHTRPGEAGPDLADLRLDIL